MPRRWFPPAAERTSRDAGTGPDGLVKVSLASLLALRRGGEQLNLPARHIASPRSGQYLSPLKGRGMEFDEVRPYQQGDDVRAIDWRVTARTGRAHTKQFREERERPGLLWLDLRPGMMFATRGAFKAVRAAQAAALAGWAAVARGDRLGGLIVSGEAHLELRPRRGTKPLLHFLSRIVDHPVWQPSPQRHEGDSQSALRQGLKRLGQVVQPGSLVFLFSDFAHLDDRGCHAIGQLARHNEVVLGFIHDSLEAELPPPGIYRFHDGRRSVSLDTGVAALRVRHRERFARRRARLERLAGLRGVRLLSMPTHTEPLTVLRQAIGGALR